MAFLLPSRASATDAANTSIAVFNVSMATGGVANFVFPVIPARTAIARDRMSASLAVLNPSNARIGFGFAVLLIQLSFHCSNWFKVSGFEESPSGTSPEDFFTRHLTRHINAIAAPK